MATQQGANTPTLYSFYGKQYDYNDLARLSDQGLNEYLGTLRRGDKDSEEFRTAYNNIMSGIRDGSITFADGEFHDSEGRYTNSDKKHRDYYGLMANYIYNQMGKSNEYVVPEDTSKIKWADDSIKTALMRQLFNSDTARLQDFLDLDEEKDGVRGITNRSKYLAQALQSIVDNWDTTFSGYQDSDKTKYVDLLNAASHAIADGTIDPGDYLALGNAIGGVDFRSLMATGTPKTTKTTTTEQPVQQNKPVETTTEQSKPIRSTKLTDGSYTPEIIKQMSATMQNIPTMGLVNILRNSFYNRDYTFRNDSRISKIFQNSNASNRLGVTATLNALYEQGKLYRADPNNANLYYIPGLKTKKGTGWVWDKANNTVSEMQLSNIPFVVYLSSQRVASHKEGGVLKAQNGASLPWYSGIQDYLPENYKTDWGNTLYAIDNNGRYGQAYGNNGAGSIDSRYKTDSKYSDYGEKGKWYATKVEEQQYFKDFTKALQDAANTYTNTKDKSTLNDNNNLFLKWAHLVDKNLPTGSTSSFFDANGNLRTSWGATNKDLYMRDPSAATSNLADYIYKVRNDQLLANRHNDLLKEGIRYFYKDEDGKQHWVDPEVAKKYNVSTKGIENIEGNIKWTDYEITGPQESGSSEPSTSGSPGTKVTPTSETNNKSNQNWGNILAEKLAPLVLSTTRLFDSLHTNNKVAKVMRESMTPVLKNTYELYSPVTGAYSEMAYRENQAADLRRQGNMAYTSDASLNAARSLDANRQATDLEYQGFLADDKEIKRTQAEALKRQEDNIARRTDVANYNRASINANNRELAQLEADRLKSNWQSRDNYLGGIETDIKQKIAQREAEREYNRKRKLSIEDSGFEAKLNYEKQQLENKYKDLQDKLTIDFQNKRQEFTKGEDVYYQNQPFYIEYLEKLRQLRDQKLQEEYALAQQHSKLSKDYIASIYDKMDRSSLFKRGGKMLKS